MEANVSLSLCLTSHLSSLEEHSVITATAHPFYMQAFENKNRR